MATKHTFVVVLPLLLCTISIQKTLSQTENWWCGPSYVEASAQCSQSCETGTGCPLGEICFSGITSCASTRYCGRDPSDANARCNTPCPNGKGCPVGEACFLNTACGNAPPSVGGGPDDAGVGSSSVNDFLSYLASSQSPPSSSSSSTSTSSKSFNGLTGVPAIEETFVQMKDAINNELFLYETPMMQWVPSTVYQFDGFFDGLKIMHTQGVAGNKIYLGGDCDHCHMYGLVNVAAFLAQAMKETIRYDACDENSWDRVGDDLMYPISNACGQLGQSYQDYHCSEEERHMECKVDPQMTITAVTNAKWWGAPGPLKCGPKSMYPQTGHWDYRYNCDNIWGDPPETCDAYDGQTGGKAINDEAYPNVAGRTDVEGCCWWGRGVIQTSGVCNFGKLNYFLGKRAADEGRDSRYPNIDFCRDPEAICSSQEHKELKWIAGFFYWISEVQRYNNGGWNYLNELHKFVDDGMEGDAFINAVSGIVNRGCHNPPCGTGELDGGPERAENFFKIIKEMKFSFVDVVPQQNPPPTTNVTPPTAQPTPGIVESALLAESPAIQAPPSQVRYTCGDGYQPDAADTSIPPSADVVFDYEIYNGIDVTLGDALRDVKGSILSDISGRIGCYQSYSGRNLQDSSDEFGSIVGLQSNANDLPDPDAGGCIGVVEMDDPATCSPISGGFTVYAKPGTAESSLKDATNSLKGIIETGMMAGLYETQVVEKAIYIGDRDNFSTSSPPVTASSEEIGNSQGMHIAIYVLASACLILICILWFVVWTWREKEQQRCRLHDEEMAFDQFMSDKNDRHGTHNTMTVPLDNDYGHMPHGRHPSPPHSMRRSFESDGVTEIPHMPPRSSSRGETRARPPIRTIYDSEDEVLSDSSKSSDTSVEDMTPVITQQRLAPRSKSAPRTQDNNSRRRPPPSRKASSEGGSVSSDSSSDSSESESDTSFNFDQSIPEFDQSIPAAPSKSMNINSNQSSDDCNNPTIYNQLFDSGQSRPSFAKEERQKRMAAARARAAKRRLS